ncbi:MAG TPA: zf-HC2 domain-containing protein [Polyangia bacterium]|nr:zf-HC2 domain-containing protein [Polyangia bacterium]
MAPGCEETSARLMDLLYGELSGDARAAVEAHLAGCVDCRAELASFQGVRAAARQALDADAPPARARDAILRAAAAAVVDKQPVAARPAPARASFWDRLRARWTLPTLATVGAVAVVVLASKVFLEPDKTVELGRRAVERPSAEAPAAPPARAKGEHEMAKREVQEQEEEAQPAPAEALAGSGAPAPVRRREAPAHGGGEHLSGRGSGFGAPPAPEKAEREFAPPPPPRAEPGPAGAPAASNALGKRALLDEEDAPAPSAGGRAGAAPAAAAPARAKAKKAEAPLSDDFDRAFAPPAPAAPAAERAEERPSAAQREAPTADQSPAETPVARADRLFAAGRWTEAARAYRELLRRDPHNADAARWRQRLAAAEQAATATAPAATPAR